MPIQSYTTNKNIKGGGHAHLCSGILQNLNHNRKLKGLLPKIFHIPMSKGTVEDRTKHQVDVDLNEVIICEWKFIGILSKDYRSQQLEKIIC